MIPLKKQKGNPLIRFSLGLRQKQLKIYRHLIKDNEAFAVASALILGYRSDLNPETLSAYSKTGVIHALSVSGMHVGIIYLVLEYLLRRMNRNRYFSGLKTVLMLTLIWGYTLLSGSSASVLRSAIMLSLFILSKSLKKEAQNSHVLYLSAFLLLCLNPSLIRDAGCQLSYLSVAGLIYFQPRLETLISFRHNLMKKLWSMLSLSMAAQAFTFPLSAYYFHQFPVYFLISNLFITLPVALLMYGGILILLFRLYWLAPAFEWLIIFMNRGLEQIAALPYPVISGIWFSKTELVLLSLFIFLTGMLLKPEALPAKNKRHLLTALSIFLFFQLSLAKKQTQTLRQHRVILFKMVRHQAAALLYGKRAVIITDLRQDDKDFKLHVKPALEQSGITASTFIFIEKIPVSALHH